MATTNIFYRIPSQRGIRVVSLTGKECTLEQFCNYIIQNQGFSREDFIVASGTKVFRPNSCSLQSIPLQNNSHVDILIPLLGGKGGFGSLLRAIGAQIEKTTNRDACRDLSGRRLRDIKREDELKKLIALRDKLEEERKRRKKEKLEKLKKKTDEISNTTSKSIQELVNMFDDHEYNRRRLEIGNIIDAAVEKGIINFKKRKLEEANETKTEAKKSKIQSNGSDIATNQDKNLIADGNESKNETVYESDGETNVNDKDLWLGLD